MSTTATEKSQDGHHADPPAATPINTVVYDIVLWFFSVIMDLFFREIRPRDAWKVPRQGPILFVAAPHANQFVDPLLLLGIIRKEAHRRVSFLTAEKSMRRKFVGASARSIGAVSVGRALDMTTSVPGRIYLPDPENDPKKVLGDGTDFTAPPFQVGGLLVLPPVGKKSAANAEIGEIVSATEIRLSKLFQGSTALVQLAATRPEPDENKEQSETSPLLDDDKAWTRGSTFKVAPKVDQTKVYNAVFERLNEGGCIGIFPEGGSHDRTELLPLKAGVAIMALGALAAKPDSNLTIIPCGMNYFHAHKFRSRAVIEFGTPLKVPPELVEMYKGDQRRQAIGTLLKLIYEALVSVTVTSPDYETLVLVQAVRRLYNRGNKKQLPLPLVIELNRRLIRGYSAFQDTDKIVALKKAVLAYDKRLRQLNIRDHQLEIATMPFYKVFAFLLYRVAKLMVLSAGVLPGLILFSPVFIISKYISVRKSREALAASTVKVQARDVIATWKVLVSLALAPVFYTVYTILLAVWNSRNNVQGTVPSWVPTWAIICFGYVFFPGITFAALRFGEVGMDIAKSLRPLILVLNPASSYSLVNLRNTRDELSITVTEVISELKPSIFPGSEFDDMIHKEEEQKSSLRRIDSNSDFLELGPGRSTSAGSQTEDEDFTNIGSVGMFATVPGTPRAGTPSIRSRTNSYTSMSDLHSNPKPPPMHSTADLRRLAQMVRQGMSTLRESQNSGDRDASHGMDGDDGSEIDGGEETEG